MVTLPFVSVDDGNNDFRVPVTVYSKDDDRHCGMSDEGPCSHEQFYLGDSDSHSPVFCFKHFHALHYGERKQSHIEPMDDEELRIALPYMANAKLSSPKPIILPFVSAIDNDPYSGWPVTLFTKENFKFRPDGTRANGCEYAGLGSCSNEQYRIGDDNPAFACFKHFHSSHYGDRKHSHIEPMDDEEFQKYFPAA